MKALVDSTALPGHARVVARDDVWMEGDAVAQFARVAGERGCVRAVAMPDLHAGRGIPIGAVFAFDGRVVPSLIGGDAGCGVRVAATAAGRIAPDKLERRAREAMEEEPLEGCDPAEVFDAVWRQGPRGLADLRGVPADLARLAAEEVDPAAVASGDPAPYRAGFESALGSVGGGNHFVEIARVSEVRDAVAAAAMGLARDALVVVAHSGSRGLGGELARRWGEGALTGEAMATYLADLAGACRFARTNRFLLAYRLLRALGAARASK